MGRKIEKSTISLNDFKMRHDFSWALNHLKEGRTVTRGQWFSPVLPISIDQFVMDFVLLIPRDEHAEISMDKKKYLSDSIKDLLIETHFVRGTLRGLWVPNWMPSMEDLLAKDWSLGSKEYREHPKTLKLSITHATG